jgi:hypothetical protein
MTAVRTFCHGFTPESVFFEKISICHAVIKVFKKNPQVKKVTLTKVINIEAHKNKI